MGWYYDFHIHDDTYEGNVASFARGGCDEYRWRIDIDNGRKDDTYFMMCVKFTDEQARQLYEWLGKELMGKSATDSYDEKQLKDSMDIHKELYERLGEE